MIIIVGAGLAGLSAAYRLVNYGQLNPRELLILEAKERIGGRVESHYFEDGSRIDLGAQWLHGERNNPIFSWLQSMDCIEGPEEEEYEFEGLFALPSGQPAPRCVVDRVLEILLEAKDFLYKAAHTLEPSTRPIDILRKHLDDQRERCPILQRADKSLVNSIERWFEVYEMIDNSCEDMSLLSIKAYSNWTNFDDGKLMLLKGGWQSVAEKLHSLIGTDRVKLGSCVKHIAYDGTGVVLSVLDEEKNTLNRLRCEHVILTCSVGVLKNFGPKFVEPPLDEVKIESFKNHGFGVANKIFLRFEKPFLQEEKGLKLLWPDACDLDGTFPDWARYITGFDLISNCPNVLLGWIGGHGALLIESMSAQQVGEICLKIFETFLPSKKPPRLIGIKQSAWATDDHIRGAYSYPKIGNNSSQTADAWEPVYCPLVLDDRQAIDANKSTPRIMFAGEASSRDMHSTAHGAILSGWREADRIIDSKKRSMASIG